MSKKVNTLSETLGENLIDEENLIGEITENKVESPNEENSKINKKKQIGVIRYLQLYPQNVYIEALLKKDYAMDLHNKEEWDQIVEEISTRKITK